jgi:hypothetical protein
MLQCGRELASRGYGILGDQFNRRCDRAPKLERIGLWVADRHRGRLGMGKRHKEKSGGQN